jgi:serine/threonine protein kinase
MSLLRGVLQTENGLLSKFLICNTEVAFWSACDHPNIVKYFGSFVERSTLYIHMAYMEGGSCFEILKRLFGKALKTSGYRDNPCRSS